MGQVQAVRPPDPAVAQQELAEPMPGPGAVGDQVGAGAAQVPHRLLGHGRHPDGDQLAGPVQPGQPPAVTTVGLDPVAGAFGINAGAITSQRTSMRCSSRCSSNPVGPAS